MDTQLMDAFLLHLYVGTDPKDYTDLHVPDFDMNIDDILHQNEACGINFPPLERSK